jgi:hypothetical protein
LESLDLFGEDVKAPKATCLLLPLRCPKATCSRCLRAHRVLGRTDRA